MKLMIGLYTNTFHIELGFYPLPRYWVAGVDRALDGRIITVDFGPLELVVDRR